MCCGCREPTETRRTMRPNPLQGQPNSLCRRGAVAGVVEVERLTGRSPAGVAARDGERGGGELILVVVPVSERPFGSGEAGRFPLDVVGPRVIADARPQRCRSVARRVRPRMPVRNLLHATAVEVAVDARGRLIQNATVVRQTKSAAIRNAENATYSLEGDGELASFPASQSSRSSSI